MCSTIYTFHALAMLIPPSPFQPMHAVGKQIAITKTLLLIIIVKPHELSFKPRPEKLRANTGNRRRNLLLMPPTNALLKPDVLLSASSCCDAYKAKPKTARKPAARIPVP